GSAHSEGDQYEWVRREKVFWIFHEQVTLAETSQILDASELEDEVISVSRIAADGTRTDSAAMPREIYLIFLFNFVISVALGFKPPITWAMYADVADYNEWRTGRRATGMTFSATTFSQKIGNAVGSALLLSVLAAMGYEAGKIQSGASLDGIVYMQTIIPGLFAICTAATLVFYNLSDDKLEQIQKELNERNG
ncbi:MAG: MFS transporter, partial [Bacteroidota bacterium]